jgi:drug/metabolite transporter (DMT)-like permease
LAQKSKNLKSSLLLLLAAIIWGFAFVAQRAGMAWVGPFTFNGIRFLLGTLTLLPLVFISCRKIGKIELIAGGKQNKDLFTGGFVAGVVLFVAVTFQQIGIVYTTAGKAGFITGLYVIIVPVIGFLFRQHISINVWFGAVMAVIGLYLLTITDGFALSSGDSLVLVSALFFAIHILVIGKFSSKVNVIHLSAFQFAIMNISFRRYEFVWDIFKTSLRIGLPTGLQQTFVATGLIALYGIVNKFGTVTIAAYGVANRIDTFASMLAMNFASALSAFVGQNIGANKPERVRTGLWTTWLITSGISIIFSIIVIFFGKEMMRIFTPDTAVIEVGNGYLVIVGSFYILFSSLFVVNAVMRGAGDTLIPMFITLISLWLIRVPASYFLAGKIGVTGIWWAIPFGWAIGLILTFIYYFTGRWKTKGVIKHI